MTKLFALTLLIPVLILSQSGFADEADQASQLLGYFLATCPTQGEWTKTALGQTQSLISVLRSIKDDPDCKSLSGAIGQLDFLSLRLQDLQETQNQREILSLKRQQQALLLQLASGPDDAMQTIIQQSLQTNQVSLAQYEGYEDYRQNVLHINESRSMRDLVLSSGVFMKQALAHQSCLIKNMSLLTGITSMAGAVAAGAVTSGASLGLGAAVNILGNVVEYIRQAPLGKKLHLFSQNISSHAYECVLESLTNQWCGAQDALNIIKAKLISLTDSAMNNPDDFETGIKILDRDLPLLLDWLSGVEAGVDPTNQGQGGRQSKVLLRREMAQSARPLGVGVLSEKMAVFDQATTTEEKWVVERSAISDLLAAVGISNGPFAVISTNSAGSVPVTNPLLDVYSAEYAPYYLLGLTLSQVPRANGSLLPFTSFDPFSIDPQNGWPQGIPPFKPDLVTVKSRFLDWLTLARSEIGLEFSKVLQPDSLSVASDAASLIRNRSPMKSINRIIYFLQKEVTAGAGPNEKIYTDTIRRLRNILNEINNIISLAPGSTAYSSCDKTKKPLMGDVDEDSARALACIYQQANLDYGTIFIQGRVRRSILIKLNDLIVKKKIGDLTTQAQFLASDDILSDLETFSGTTNLTVMKRGVQKSQEATDKNLQDFLGLFGRNIAEALREKMNLEKKLGTSGESYYATRAEVCLMLAAAPAWPKDIPQSYCLDVQLPASIPGGPSSVKLTSKILLKPHNERACFFRDYFRQSQIYQDYQGEKSESHR